MRDVETVKDELDHAQYVLGEMQHRDMPSQQELQELHNSMASQRVPNVEFAQNEHAFTNMLKCLCFFTLFL